MKKLCQIAALSAIALGSACDDREVSVSIVQMQLLSDSCTASTDTSEALIRGVVDTGLARSYVVYPLVENHMIDLIAAKGYSAQDGRQDTHSIILKEAVYKWKSNNSLAGLPSGKQKQALSATIGVQGQAAVGIEVLSSEDLATLRDQDFDEPSDRKKESVTLTLKLKGETQDGRDVETEEFSFPVTICNGCLITYPAGANDPGQKSPNCNGSAEDVEDPACPMQVGTDMSTIDCRLCPGYAADVASQKLCQPL